MECFKCEEEFKTIRELERHLVKDHKLGKLRTTRKEISTDYIDRRAVLLYKKYFTIMFLTSILVIIETICSFAYQADAIYIAVYKKYLILTGIPSVSFLLSAWLVYAFITRIKQNMMRDLIVVNIIWNALVIGAFSISLFIEIQSGIEQKLFFSLVAGTFTSCFSFGLKILLLIAIQHLYYSVKKFNEHINYV